MPVLSADEADEVSKHFCWIYLKVRPSSSQSCVGFSAGGGVCGNRVRRACAASMVGVPEPPWAAALPVKGGSLLSPDSSSHGWLRGVENTLAALPWGG